MWWLEREKKITSAQSGFRKLRSTTDAIVEFETVVRETIANKQHLVAVFFDIKKAYNTAWRDYIIRKLISYGVRGHLLHFMKGFLSNRRISVRVNSTHSDVYTLTEGIPQGSVLSCTCFLVAINDIEKDLPRGVGRTLYVDDFTIYYRARRITTARRQIQIALRKIEEWTNKTGFVFSRDKTVSMHICRVPRCNKMPLDLHFNNNILKYVESHRLLGMQIDSSLTWKTRIQKLKESCTRKIDSIKFLSNSSWGADKEVLLRLYTALINPVPSSFLEPSVYNISDPIVVSACSIYAFFRCVT